ncbi:MAG: hypothetical protein IPH18_07930 [Chitinophagaceae bacterium]|nr:hypothetical protein [Chitinophagaceae bacterium]
MLRFLFLFLAVVHGLIHLLGFVKAFNISPVQQLTAAIPKVNGVLWLLAKKNSEASVSMLTENDIGVLPPVVQQYVRYTGSLNKPKVINCRIRFCGRIRKDEKSGWMHFASEQNNFFASAKRFFFMNATMKQMPVAGYHCFENGKASMDIRLFSLFRVQYQHGPEMDTAETVTMLNDMCCMAPATLIDKRITWEQADSHKAKAIFSNNGITVSAWLYFNEKVNLSISFLITAMLIWVTVP